MFRVVVTNDSGDFGDKGFHLRPHVDPYVHAEDRRGMRNAILWWVSLKGIMGYKIVVIWL